MSVDFRLMLGDVDLGIEAGEDAIGMVDLVTILVLAHKEDLVDGLVREEFLKGGEGIVVLHGDIVFFSYYKDSAFF
jgi:hypothetical protein